MARVVKQLLKRKEKEFIDKLLSDPKQFSYLLMQMDPTTRLKLLSSIPPEKLADLLFEVPPLVRIEFLKTAPLNLVVNIVKNLSDDDAVDLLEEVPLKRVKKILAKLPKEKRNNLFLLLRYPPDTAGGLMTREFVSFKENMLVSEAIELLRKKGAKTYIVYVVDEKGRVKGFVSLKRLIVSDPNKKIGEIMKKNFVAVRPELDREEVVRLFYEKDLQAMAVVDGKGRLIGVITLDDVLEALEEELSEDIARITGTTESIRKILTASPIDSAKARLPWLFFTVVGEILFTGKIIEAFQGTLSKVIALSFFLPVLMCLAGDAGMQTATVVVRGIAMGELKDFRRFLEKELKVSALLGLISGLASGLLAFFFTKSLKIAFVVSFSIFVSLIAASFIGAVLPLLFKRLGADPAVSAGPLITTVMDAISVLIYFTTAYLTLSFLI